MGTPPSCRVLVGGCGGGGGGDVGSVHGGSACRVGREEVMVVILEVAGRY